MANHPYKVTKQELIDFMAMTKIFIQTSMENQRNTWKQTVLPNDRKSLTIPGQSLLPAELLKRHLAGTLPDIDHSSRYEYHYDENGEQIGEPLPIEMHELHKLAVAIRKRQFEEATKHREQQALKFREKIIEEYKSLQKSQTPPSSGSASPDDLNVKSPEQPSNG